MNVNYQNGLLKCRLTSSTLTHVLQQGSSLLVYLTFKSLQIFQQQALAYFNSFKMEYHLLFESNGIHNVPNIATYKFLTHENPINLFSNISAN